jgi:hypothetical protein
MQACAGVMSTVKQQVTAALAAVHARQHAHPETQQKTDQAEAAVHTDLLLVLAVLGLALVLVLVPSQVAMLQLLQPTRMLAVVVELEAALRGDRMQVVAAAAAAAACQWLALATPAGMTIARSPSRSSSSSVTKAGPRLLLQQTPAALSA